MPFVEGESLRDRLNREKQLPVEEAVRIAGEVAEALQAAHDDGIIHRDVKPANILLRKGKPLVADFGIALAVSAAGGGRLTETGLSLGTPHYMSPEQAAGDRELDARSDLYSLGAVAYEMLVGEPPHVGNTAQAVVAKILSDAPAPIRRTRELVPVNVEAAVAKALARSPADRFSSAAEFAVALTNPGFTLPSMVVRGDEAVAAAVTGKWRVAAAALGAVIVILAGLALWGWLRPAEAPTVARYRLAFLEGQEPRDMEAISFDISVEGKAIVYVGPGERGGQLWVKWLDRTDPEPIPGTAGGIYPSISPDVSDVLFSVDGQLKRVSLQGGASVTVADSVLEDRAIWTADGDVIYGDQRWRLHRIPSARGESAEVWPEQPGDRAAWYPSPIGDTGNLLFTLSDRSFSQFATWVWNARSGEAKELIPGALGAWYLASGHLAFLMRDGSVYAAPFDKGALELTGPRTLILEGVKIDAIDPDIAVVPDGTLLMVRGGSTAFGVSQEVIWVTRAGIASPVDPSWQISLARNLGSALSPDGTRLAIGLWSEDGDDIWIKELDDGPHIRLTDHPGEDQRPMWSLDGEEVFFITHRRDGPGVDLWVMRADGATEARPFLVRDASVFDTDLTPDGEWMVARVGGAAGTSWGRDIVAYHLEGDTAEIPLLTSDHDEVSPRLSPDGRWLAYSSDETGAWEVYVRPFPDVEAGKFSVSRGGGLAPLWAHSGREVFYESPDGQMMAATIDTVGGFKVLDQRILFQLPTGVSVYHRTTAYDVSLDDQRFIMVRAAQAQDPQGGFDLILVENWAEEIKERVRAQRG
jgi:serine/threonine-protein kinase